MKLGHILAIASLTMLIAGLLFQWLPGYDLTDFDILNLLLAVFFFWFGWTRRNRRTYYYNSRMR